MGNDPTSKEYDELLRDYTQIQESQGEGLRYLEHKTTQEEYLLREINCHDKEAYQKCKGNLGEKSRHLNGNRHIVSLVRVISQVQEQYCMTFYKVWALFEFPQRTLDD